MVCIDIKSLTTGIHEYDLDLDAEALELDPDIFDALHAHVRLDFRPSQLYVTIRVLGVARLRCDRTLKEYDQPVSGDYGLLFSSPELFAEEGPEDEDVRPLWSGQEEIDLTDAMRDTFMLALPQRRIAPGAESEEIPLQFGLPSGIDAEIDPRWDVLRQLKLRAGNLPDEP